MYFAPLIPVLITFIMFELILKLLIKDKFFPRDELLVGRYITDFYYLLLFNVVVVLMFILLGYQWLPEYIFSEIYHAVFIIFSYILITVSLLNLKHGVVPSFTKEFARKLAFNQGHSLSKQNLISGIEIKYVGAKAKALNLTAIIFGVVAIFLTLKL
ncbi:hypothetical protein HYV31_02825 [candidate division WWE3 bacterium]|nr:hypothetical protein [candidate division WWE3 bacterium]